MNRPVPLGAMTRTHAHGQDGRQSVKDFLESRNPHNASDDDIRRAHSIFFGSDPHPSRIDPYQQQSHTRWQLPAFQQGQINMFMRTIQNDRVTKAATFLIHEVLPFRQAAPGARWRYEKWIFDDHLLGRTPEETGSRLVSSRREEQSGSLRRMGIAMMMNWGFMFTDAGRRQYWESLVQIARAITETASLGIMNALLSTEEHRMRDVQRRRNRPLNSLSDFNRAMKPYLRNWGRVQKSMHGFNGAVEELKKLLMDDERAEGNYLLVPRGVGAYVRQAPEENHFFLSGRPTNGGFQRDIFSESGKLVIREGRTFATDAESEDIDPMYRDVSIGTFAKLEWRPDENPTGERTSRVRNVKVYDESRDDWAELDFVECLFRYSGLFTSDGYGGPDTVNMEHGFSQAFANLNSLAEFWTEAHPHAWPAFKRAHSAMSEDDKEAFRARLASVTGDEAKHPAEAPTHHAGSVFQALHEWEHADRGDGVERKAQPPSLDHSKAAQAVAKYLKPLLERSKDETWNKLKGSDRSAKPGPFSISDILQPFIPVLIRFLTSGIVPPRKAKLFVPTVGALIVVLEAGGQESNRDWPRGLVHWVLTSLVRDRSVREDLFKSLSEDYGTVGLEWLERANLTRPQQREEDRHERPGGILEKQRDQTDVMRLLPAVLRAVAEHGLPLPISLIAVRPSQVYSMGTMVMVARGPEFGWTYRGESNFAMSDSVARKVHYGHYTTEMAPVIHQPERVALMHNAFCGAYLGGNGVQIWDPSDPSDRQAVEDGLFERKDMFIIPQIGTLDSLPQPFDLTGNYHPKLTPNNFGNNRINGNGTHYQFAASCRALWGWAHAQDDGMDPGAHHKDENTLVFQETQLLYSGLGKFDTRVRGQGHWGDDVYPGCGDIRCGKNPGHLQAIFRAQPR